MSNCAQYRRNEWVALKVAADQSKVHEETMRGWAQEKLIKARQLASTERRSGTWRVWVDNEGLPVEPDAQIFPDT